MKKSILTFLFVLTSIFALGQTAQEKEKIKNMMIQSARELNQQMPMYVDEYTTLASVVFHNWVWTYTYNVNFEKELLSESERKELINDIRINTNIQQKKNIDLGLFKIKRSELRWFMKQTGFKFRYVYLDPNGSLIGTFILTYLNF